MERIVLQVSGMSCSGCEERLGTVLRRVEGVRAAMADHVCGRVEVRVGSEFSDPALLAERIEAAGFQVIEEESG
jgi:copper chaperone